MDEILVYVMVAAAVFYAFRSLVKSFKSGSCSCCSCDAPSSGSCSGCSLQVTIDSEEADGSGR